MVNDERRKFFIKLLLVMTVVQDYVKHGFYIIGTFTSHVSPQIKVPQPPMLES